MGTSPRALGWMWEGWSPAFAGVALHPALLWDSLLCWSWCQGIVKLLQKAPGNEAQTNTYATTNSKTRADGRNEPAREMYPGVSVAADVNTAWVFFFFQMLGEP